jgi:ribosome maturation factor RimP
MANFKENITKIIEPLANEAAEPLGLKVLRMVVRGSEQTPVIEIIIDGEKAVTLENCADISRHINDTLEDNKAVKGNFRLDVMSPGVEEPLTEMYQWKRNIGRLVKVQTKEDHHDKTFTGRLQEIEDNDLIFELTGAKGAKLGHRREKETVPMDHIKTAVVQVEFNSVNLDEENL